MKSKLIALVAVFALSGCANQYLLDGVKYDSKETFNQAVDKFNADALNSIQPLPSAVTKKKLIIAFPSKEAIFAESVSRYTKAMGKAPSGLVLDQIVNLSGANFRMSKVFADGVQKRGIYASSKFMEMPSMTASLEPAADADVLYFVEPAISTGQWFFATQKHGKQVFGYDRSGIGATAKVQAFSDAVLAQAIRE